MELKKLTIQVEAKSSSGARPQFDQSSEKILALFNPNRLVFSKTANWQKQDAKTQDNPELQYTNSEPCTLTLELIFDTYDTPDATKSDVRDHTNAVTKLIMVDGAKHRPPVCRLSWGSAGVFFQGVLQSLEQQFTLFLETGTPVRAHLRCTFKEWWTNYDQLNKQNLQSADLAKQHVVKRGDSLAGIAARSYHDPTLWRPIAEANGLDDPRRLEPGRVLLIPALTPRSG